MASHDKILHLTLGLEPIEQIEPDELDRLTHQLRNEVRELPVETVEFVSGDAAPKGSKGPLEEFVGELLVVVAVSGSARLVEFLVQWLARQKRRMRLKAQLGDSVFMVEYPLGKSLEELKPLVNAWISALAQEGTN